MPGPAIHLLVLTDLRSRLAAAGGSTAARVLEALTAHPRHAALGAIGPDLLYLAGPPALTKFERAVTLMTEAAHPFAAPLRRSVRPGGDVTALLQAGVAQLEAYLAQDLAGHVVEAGRDLLAHLQPALQDGAPETAWRWGDLLHYRRTGRFAAALLEQARTAGQADLLAYAAGYASHVAADAVGHAYVNTIVGGPYRLHYHRHRLVEAQMDAWAWHARYGSDLGAAGLAAQVDLGQDLPKPLERLLRTALATVYGGDPQPAAPPDLGAAYQLLRRLLAAFTGGQWRRMEEPAQAGLAACLWRRVHARRQEVRAALTEVSLAYPGPDELDPALYRVPDGPPDPSYPRASIHVPGGPNLASPLDYPPTPPDGLAAILGRDGKPYPGPPWQASRIRDSLPDAFIAEAARTAAAFALGAAIPDLNLDADPIEGVRCWRALDDLRSERYRLQEL